MAAAAGQPDLGELLSVQVSFPRLLSVLQDILARLGGQEGRANELCARLEGLEGQHGADGLAERLARLEQAEAGRLLADQRRDEAIRDLERRAAAAEEQASQWKAAHAAAEERSKETEQALRGELGRHAEALRALEERLAGQPAAVTVTPAPATEPAAGAGELAALAGRLDAAEEQLRAQGEAAAAERAVLASAAGEAQRAADEGLAGLEDARGRLDALERARPAAQRRPESALPKPGLAARPDPAAVEALTRRVEELEGAAEQAAGARADLAAGLRAGLREAEAGRRTADDALAGRVDALAQESRDTSAARARELDRQSIAIDRLEEENRKRRSNGADVTREYVDRHITGLSRELQNVRGGVKKTIHSELRVFERDLQEYMDDRLDEAAQAGHSSGHGTDEASGDGRIKGAAGRMHFRCLTCDNVLHTVDGPATPAQKAATLMLPQPKPREPEPVLVGEKLLLPGESTDLYGPNGEIFKGRAPPRVKNSTPTTAGSHRLSRPGTAARGTRLGITNSASPTNGGGRPTSAPPRRPRPPMFEK